MRHFCRHSQNNLAPVMFTSIMATTQVTIQTRLSLEREGICMSTVCKLCLLGCFLFVSAT